jgi:soluble lytic murein transglycosylase-like protein
VAAGYSFLHRLHSRCVTKVRVDVGMRIFHHIGPALVIFLLPTGVLAGEYAVLANGFRIHADRHELTNGRIRLFAGGGVTEFAAGDVASFEMEEPEPALPKAAVSAVPATPPAIAKKQDMYSAAAEMHGLPLALIRSVVKAESNFQLHALSPKGAIGLMQLMPSTARELGVDPHIPAQNVEAGARYLRGLLIKYSASEDQVARAIAAYNAGPAAVDRYHGVPPYLETQTYVRRVLREYLKKEN